MLGVHLVASRVRRDERSPTGRPRRLAYRRHRIGGRLHGEHGDHGYLAGLPGDPRAVLRGVGVGAQLDLQCLQHRCRQPPSNRRLALGALRPQTDLPDRRVDLPPRFGGGRFRRVQRDADRRPHRSGDRWCVAGAVGSRPGPRRRPARPAPDGDRDLGCGRRPRRRSRPDARRAAGRRVWVAGGVLDQYPGHRRGAGSRASLAARYPAVARHRRR